MRRVLLSCVLLAAAAGCRAPCSSDSQCASDEFCHHGVCEEALDRWWEVTIEAAGVGAVHPDGAAWDVDGGPPDLLVDFGVAGDVCMTSTAWDDYTPWWNEYCDLWFSEHDPYFVVDLWDQDDSIDEWVTGWAWEGRYDVVHLLRSCERTVRVYDDTGTVWLDLHVVPW